MGVPQLEIVRLYLKIGDMFATISNYYWKRRRLAAER
jgi:hypothetical protein